MPNKSPPIPTPDVPQCDTQPMPSQAAFRTLSTQVHEDYDCTLNQTNIGNNNNKFYIIQLLEEGGRFSCWNRWGRVVSEPSPGLPSPTFPSLGTLQGDPKSHPLTPSPAVQRSSAQPRGRQTFLVERTPESCPLQGEVGQSKMNHFGCLEDAKKDFKKKFWEKTKNKWEERDHFVAHPNKYTLIEVQGEAETQEAVVKVKGQ